MVPPSRRDKPTICPRMGDASYYDIKVDGKENEDAAFYYPEPKRLRHNQRPGRIWKRIAVE
jgi:uncharacterized protein (DUF427 family)